ncbi:MAG: DUF1667 domain-containing protein [Proteobacteria bacterium]|nr:DUF1667 domain-containing protein [Pseudomonadota bacterium]
MEKKVKTITCIICPKGCDLKLRQGRKGQWSVSGNDCDRGIDYALEEMSSPRRVLTTTVALAGGNLPLLPVRSSVALPKETLFECLKILSGIERYCPVDIGDVIVSDILDTGIDIIATRSVQ